MNETDLTSRQQHVLRFIEQQIAHQGYPPTIREIGRHLGIRSTNGVNDHLKALQRKGYLTRHGQKSRTLRIVKATGRVTELDPAPIMPLTDNIGAQPRRQIPFFHSTGDLKPFFSLKDAGDTIEISHDIVGANNTDAKLFATRFWGENLAEDGLENGDLLILRESQTPQLGDRILIRWRERTLLRRYFSEGDMIRLQPSDARLGPLFIKKIDFDRSTILGILAALIRVF